MELCDRSPIDVVVAWLFLIMLLGMSGCIEEDKGLNDSVELVENESKNVTDNESKAEKSTSVIIISKRELYGYVIDYDGAPIKGATVTLKEIEGEFVEEFTPERHQKHFLVETDENGYYEFRTTFLSDPIQSGKWTLEIVRDVGSREYVAWGGHLYL